MLQGRNSACAPPAPCVSVRRTRGRAQRARRQRRAEAAPRLERLGQLGAAGVARVHCDEGHDAGLERDIHAVEHKALLARAQRVQHRLRAPRIA
jgi:hypothetical protein